MCTDSYYVCVHVSEVLCSCVKLSSLLGQGLKSLPVGEESSVMSLLFIALNRMLPSSIRQNPLEEKVQ